MKSILSRQLLSVLVFGSSLWPGTAQFVITTSLSVVRPGEYTVGWDTGLPLTNGQWAFQVEVADNLGDLWRPLVGYTIDTNAPLRRVHRSAAPTRYFRVREVGWTGNLPLNLTPLQAESVHGGFLTDRNLAFDEAVITFNSTSSLDEIEDAAGTRWRRQRVISPTVSWWRVVDGLSTGDRGDDLARQLAALNLRSDVKVAYPVLMYMDLRFWMRPRFVFKGKPGAPFGDLMSSLGNKVAFDGSSLYSPEWVYLRLTEPKADNIFGILHRFQTHPSIEAADLDGYVEVRTAASQPGQFTVTWTPDTETSARPASD